MFSFVELRPQPPRWRVFARDSPAKTRAGRGPRSNDPKLGPALRFSVWSMPCRRVGGGLACSSSCVQHLPCSRGHAVGAKVSSGGRGAMRTDGRPAMDQTAAPGTGPERSGRPSPGRHGTRPGRGTAAGLGPPRTQSGSGSHRIPLPATRKIPPARREADAPRAHPARLIPSAAYG